MVESYQLLVRTIHFTGISEYSAGRVNTREEALKWVEKHQGRGKNRFKLPENDPVRWCPVKHCHMKGQTPVFYYRAIEKPYKKIA